MDVPYTPPHRLEMKEPLLKPIVLKYCYWRNKVPVHTCNDRKWKNLDIFLLPRQCQGLWIWNKFRVTVTGRRIWNESRHMTTPSWKKVAADWGVYHGKFTWNLKISHPKRKGSSSKHHFSGTMLNFGGVLRCFSMFPSLSENGIQKKWCRQQINDDYNWIQLNISIQDQTFASWNSSDNHGCHGIYVHVHDGEFSQQGCGSKIGPPCVACQISINNLPKGPIWTTVWLKNKTSTLCVPGKIF